MTQPNAKANVLPEGAQRTQGVSAQEMNLIVAGMVAGVVKTTLGPKGMDKLLVDSLGDVTVTNDGVTILREMTMENPIAKMMVEIAKNQEIEVGDGTTTAVVLAGELLKKAKALLKKKIHATVIAKGYKIASNEALRILEKIGVEVNPNKITGYKDVLENIAKTAMTGKGAEDQKEKISKIVVDACLKVSDGRNIDLTNIKVEKKTGGGGSDTSIIEGIILDKNRLHPTMPKLVEGAKIALLDTAIEIKSMEMDAKVNITDPGQINQFMQNEAETLQKMIKNIVDSGANVVFTGRSIDDAAIHFLAKAGILAVKRVKREDLELISMATNAHIVTEIGELGKNDIGNAGKVSEKFIGDTDMTFIEGCKDAKSLTILVRGSTEQTTAEVKRAIEDALGDIASMIRTYKAVGGAGSTEMILSRKLKDFATKHTGRLQLAIEAFAEAMEIIPEVLAENAGLDPIDIMAELKNEIQSDKYKWPGINVFEGKVWDAWQNGIIEPLQVKTQAISSAAEVAMSILRIDDVIAIMHDPDQKKAQMAATQ
jgi:thermosome